MGYICEPCSAKGINPGQPAQSTQAHQGQNFLTLSQTSPDFYMSAVNV